MGKSDTALVTWFGNKKRFADLYNGSVFQGEQVVEAEQLEAEQTSTKELVEGREGILRDVERNRDIVMKWNDGMNLVLLACENQDKIHYAMPVRTMLYDGLSYAEQIRELRIKNKVKKNKGADEFLSGISKEDKLYPVITLVFYYGDKAWDGSKELHGLLKESSNPKIREVVERMVPNYHINLLDINSLEDTSLYKTDLQVVFGMLKYKKNRKKIEKYMQENSEFFRHVDIDTYNVLRVLLKAEKQMEALKGQEEVDMCEALQEIFDDGKEAGRLEGEKIGKSQGKMELLLELVKEGDLDVSRAAAKAGKTEAEFRKLLK